jgi:hypothetical protein
LSTFELGVRGFGSGGPQLAQQLRTSVAQWHATGRPATAGLRIRAYPPGHATNDQSATIINKHYSRLLLDWPQQPDHHST